MCNIYYFIPFHRFYIHYISFIISSTKMFRARHTTKCHCSARANSLIYHSIVYDDAIGYEESITFNTLLSPTSDRLVYVILTTKQSGSKWGLSCSVCPCNPCVVMLSGPVYVILTTKRSAPNVRCSCFSWCHLTPVPSSHLFAERQTFSSLVAIAAKTHVICSGMLCCESCVD